MFSLFLLVKFAHNFAIGRNFTHASRTSLSKITSLAQRANLVFFIQRVPAIGLFFHKLPNIPTARTNFIFLFAGCAFELRPIIVKARHSFVYDFPLAAKASVFDVPRGVVCATRITVFIEQHGCGFFIPFLHLITY